MAYGQVSPTFWNDDKARTWSQDGRHLALYLMTCPQASGEGFYPLSVATALDDLHWTRAQWDAALAELTEAGFCEYDRSARLVLVCKALKYHYALSNVKAIAGALTALDAAKGSPDLFGRFLEAADRYQPRFASAIREHYQLPDGPYRASEDRQSPD
jgi:hypothetical protein